MSHPPLAVEVVPLTPALDAERSRPAIIVVNPSRYYKVHRASVARDRVAGAPPTRAHGADVGLDRPARPRGHLRRAGEGARRRGRARPAAGGRPGRRW